MQDTLDTAPAKFKLVLSEKEEAHSPHFVILTA